MQVDDAHDIDAIMPMYNLIEYSDISSKTSGRSLQYCREEPAFNMAGAIDLPPDNNDSICFLKKK